MKKNIIISLFLLLLIVMIGSCARSRGYVEGLTGTLTKLTIDNTETTSMTAATPVVISDFSLADNSVITVDIDQIGDGTAKGLKIYLIGYRA